MTRPHSGLFVPAGIAVVLTALPSTAFTPRGPTVAFRPGTVIALERHACLGDCPVYAIQIAANGTAKTIGLEHTPDEGPFTVRVSAEKMSELNRAFAEAKFCTLDDSYISKGNRFISDIPGTYLSFRCGEQMKTVYDYYGTPAIVRTLEHQVEQAARLERFLFADRALLEAKFAAGVKPDSQEAQQFLLEAVEWKDEELVRYLLEEGVDAKAPGLRSSYDGRSSPLVNAVLSNQIAITRLLVEHGADLHETSASKATLLADAVHGEGSAEMISALIEMGSDVNATDAGGSTPLMYAAMRERPDLTQILLDAGADRNFQTETGLSALDYARQAAGCGNSAGGLNTVSMEDDPDYTLCDRAKTIALLEKKSK